MTNMSQPRTYCKNFDQKLLGYNPERKRYIWMYRKSSHMYQLRTVNMLKTNSRLSQLNMSQSHKDCKMIHQCVPSKYPIDTDNTIGHFARARMCPSHTGYKPK